VYFSLLPTETESAAQIQVANSDKNNGEKPLFYSFEPEIILSLRIVAGLLKYFSNVRLKV
jgi:hypothetical protein